MLSLGEIKETLFNFTKILAYFLRYAYDFYISYDLNI